MRNGIQSVYLSLGNEACFFLQLLNIAEKSSGHNIDIETATWLCSLKGFIYLNWNDLTDKKNFLINKHADILELFTGKRWLYTKESPSYKAKKNEYIINEWQNGSFIHFDSDDFHSLQKSNTIEKGKIISRRVFKIV